MLVAYFDFNMDGVSTLDLLKRRNTIHSHEK